jgi:hypothetical protein
VRRSNCNIRSSGYSIATAVASLASDTSGSILVAAAAAKIAAALCIKSSRSCSASYKNFNPL